MEMFRSYIWPSVYPCGKQQTYEMSLYDVAWSVDDGVTAKWDVNLSSGNNREMNIKIGYGSSSDYTIIYDVDMVLEQGSTSGEITLGDVDAEYVIIQTQEINWTAQSSFPRLLNPFLKTGQIML